MVTRVLLVFLVVSLALIYSIDSMLKTIDLDSTKITTLVISHPGSNDIQYTKDYPQDIETMERVSNWFNTGKLAGVSIIPKFTDWNVFTIELDNNKKLLIYTPLIYDDTVYVKDYNIPVYYKMSTIQSATPELKGLYQTKAE